MNPTIFKNVILKKLKFIYFQRNFKKISYVDLEEPFLLAVLIKSFKNYIFNVVLRNHP